MSKHIEMIISYTVDGEDFQYSDNHGVLIRCANCKWFQCNVGHDGNLAPGVDMYECRHWCGGCDPTDFCSYAERRADG